MWSSVISRFRTILRRFRQKQNLARHILDLKVSVDRSVGISSIDPPPTDDGRAVALFHPAADVLPASSDVACFDESQAT